MWACACADAKAGVGGGKGLMSVPPSSGPRRVAIGGPSGARSVLAALYMWVCVLRGSDAVDMVFERGGVE